MPALVTPTPVTCPQFPENAMRADGAQGQVTSNSTRELGEAIVTAMSLPQPQLRIFRGDVLDFQSFMDSFDFRVGRRPLSDPDKLHHLKEYLDGEPRVLVEGCLRIPGGFAHAIKLLNETYGNEFKLAHAYMGKLSAWPTITESDDAEGLKALSCFMIRAANAMKGLKYAEKLNHPDALREIAEKLPIDLQNKWAVKGYRLVQQNGDVSMSDLCAFVKEASDIANCPMFGKKQASKKKNSINESATRPKQINQPRALQNFASYATKQITKLKTATS
jgi:hypothetical protein